MHFNNGFSFACVIYHRFLYTCRLQKIVILKSNYCQGKFHLFFAIEHAQKLKSLVKVAENPCWEWNFRAEKFIHIHDYWSWTVQTDDWRWDCSWNHCESRGDPGASRMDIFERKVLKGVLHPRPVFGLFLHFSQKLQHIGNK